MPDSGQNTSYTNTFGEDNDYSINIQKFRVKNSSLSQAILTDDTLKNLPTGQYVFTLYGPEKTVVSRQILTKENP
ncbi:MAG: hypothetical protein CK532_02490 [Flavobacteriales bacterium]|nr:MAG: hypothetical protein CK532_02490 [Flavobacteriales bacterium]